MLVHSSGKVSRGGLIASAISVLCLAAAVLHADSQLQIASPANGLLVNAGCDLTVVVKTPDVAVQSVSIDGDGPFALSTGVSKPPYRFTYPIPAGAASGRYRLKAVGVTASGTINSEPVEVDVEQAEKPKKLESEWQSVSMVAHENSTLVIWGIFEDGAKVDVTRSTQIAYTSDRPAVAAISSDGTISAASAGKVRITVKYADKTILVPVAISSGH